MERDGEDMIRRRRSMRPMTEAWDRRNEGALSGVCQTEEWFGAAADLYHWMKGAGVFVQEAKGRR